MIIGACGFGATGSSVLTDLLKEYDDMQVYDRFEFVIPYRVDGIQDLEYHLVKKYSKSSSGDYAIKRFLSASKCYKTPFINKPFSGNKFYNISKQYINNIEQLNYRGIETADMMTGNILRNICAFFSKKVLMKYLQKIFKRKIYLWPSRKIHFCIKPQNFYDESQKYIEKILLLMGADLNKNICLDQPFEGNNPKQSMKFFKNPYAIIIDRDPRDLYLEYKYSLHPDFKFFPHSNVDDFIIYYKNLRQDEYREDNNITRINFEDFIYEYEKTVEKLEKLFKISNHNNKQKWFKPSKSIKNTRLIKKYPNDIDEIKKIEKELEVYLYPFEKYNN